MGEWSPIELEGYKLLDALIKVNWEDGFLEEYCIRIYNFNFNFVILINRLLMY